MMIEGYFMNEVEYEESLNGYIVVNEEGLYLKKTS
jgi:hypothetical protein